MEILIRKGDIDDNIRFELPYKFDQLGNIVGVNLCNFNFPVNLRGDFPALAYCPARKADFTENFRCLRAFVGDNLPDPASTYYKNF
jgi:hypothetical protein